jgi:hypothetical protein
VEYFAFVRAMDQLRNMKLVKISGDGKAGQALIKVTAFSLARQFLSN